MRNSITLLFTILVVAHSLPLGDPKAEVLEYENTNDGTGNYRFRFKTSDGITRSETGEFVNGHSKVTGEVYYTSPEGKPLRFSYIADENGYHFQTVPIDTEIPIDITAPSPALLASLLGRK